ncbi:CheR family methyltransferase [Gloeothece verrucosa]|uniref:protein-glutamate O-methyltransferase n=1 Tax=Gloeothece verrucosa (strain PCC 7822) TaxID=497965 RepID=E0UB22_GLOV7|nr:protein-glutamate O-methyltransferase CheR [Gloeothece verrucosa]ADN16267.1 MCP methyltransferase, CheR-type [Gloeothece verrucosa PCC 7822]
MTTSEFLSSELKQEFIDLIAKQTGIEIREQNYAGLSENIYSRLKTLKLDSPQAYYYLLATPNHNSDQEWQQFVCLMTNKESYFFRDKGQFILLRNKILPELIQRKQKSQHLRILSAGCSTGQEPYSLAILLRQMIPDFAGWHIKILGIDINQDAITQARKGVYNAWSFRQVDEEIKEKYFNFTNEQYELNQSIKSLVKFERINLAKDIFPQMDTDLRDMDLIICRNVFIYFTYSAIVNVIEKFYNTLQIGGYLLTGHAELSPEQVRGFQVHLFPESVIYQKREKWVSQSSVSHPAPPQKTALEKLSTQLNNTVIRPPQFSEITALPKATKPLDKIVQNLESKPQPSIPPTPLKSSLKDEELLQEAESLIAAKSYYLANKKIEEFLSISPRSFSGHYLLAKIQANLGKHEAAIQACKKAIEIDSFSVAPYHLLVQISEEKGDLEEAKTLLKKIIYLEPCSVSAYLNLANLYQQEGDQKRSEKMQQTALTILKKLPNDTQVPELGNITVQELLTQLE